MRFWQGVCMVLLVVFFLFVLGCYRLLSGLSERQLLVEERILGFEQKQFLLEKELLMRTDPAYVDNSLRVYFDSLLRESPDQVRGIDGKLAKER